MADLFQHLAKTSAILATDGGMEASGYAPLPLRNLVVGAPVEFDVFLKIKSKKEIVPQFMQCTAAGEEFQKPWLARLHSLQIRSVYFAREDTQRVTAYLQHHLELALGDKNFTELEKASMACDAAQIWGLNFFTNEQSQTDEQVKVAFGFLTPIYDALQKNRDDRLALLDIRRQGLRLYNHCLQASMLGMAFTSFLKWTADKARGFGMGALVHDVGLSQLPQAILDKPGPLAEEERYKVRRHPMDGFHLLKKNIRLRYEALQMVYQHHENCDGSGYPEGQRLNSIHNWARILRIVDSYAAMTADRPWRPAMTPKEALWTMREEWETKKIYDGNLLKAFFKFLAS